MPSHQLRAQLEQARMTAHAAERTDSAEWQHVRSLERQLQLAEQADASPDLAKAQAALRLRTAELTGAMQRIDLLEDLIGRTIGRQLGGMSSVAIGSALHEPKHQLQLLQQRITGGADLDELRRIVANQRRVAG